MKAAEDVSVTAGIGGFLVFFFLALALWLLMRNMFARLRRMRYREEARLEAEREAEAGPPRGGAPGNEPPGDARGGAADGPEDPQAP